MIPLTKPTFNNKELKAVKETLDSGWVTQGPRVRAFEDAFADYVEAQHACAVSNCTSSLQIALLTVGVKPGDIVITVSHSFIATANSIRWCGAEPFFIDIESATYNMDPKILEQFLTHECEIKNGYVYYKNVDNLSAEASPFQNFHKNSTGRIAAIMPVHQVGMPCDIEQIVRIARKFNVPVVEDAACAIGSEIQTADGRWEKIGKPHGDIACFSFHPRKIITTGEGGMLTTNNTDYDHMFRLLRHQGMDTSDLKRSKAKKIIFEKYVLTAFNYRMTDIQAAIGLAQLKKLPSILKKRRKIAALYAKELQSLDFLEIPKMAENVETNWQSYVVRIQGNNPSNRNAIMQQLLDKGIASRPGIMNSHQELPYRSNVWKLPESEKARDAAMLLPLFPSMTKSQLKTVVSVLKSFDQGIKT